MSIRTKGKIIAGTPRNSVDLLDFKWSDHLLDDISWLRADTFSWQPGSVYVAVYEHLANEFDITKPIEAETFSGVTVYFRRSPDGHKIVLADGEQDVINMYNTTGIAWYYILDTTNKRFKLPRTKFGFTGLRDSVGGYVSAGLPNITGSAGYLKALKAGNYYQAINFSSGAFKGSTSDTSGLSTKPIAVETGTQETTNAGGVLNFSASNSSAVYGASNTVQPKATQMYLYFYVGNSVRNEHEIDVGALAEAVNNFDVLAATDAVNETRDAAIVSVNATKDTSIQDIEAARDNSVSQLESMGNALNHTNITNCVTKIPQDIKLELKNGTLTLKAGSKVYVPNGAGKFDVVQITENKTRTETVNGTYYLVLNPSDGYLNRGGYPSTSGTTAPTTVTTGTVWYDTENNRVKRYSGGTWSNMSLPLCVYTVSGGSIVSIDQVFNGFGYIGSSRYFLPDVEVLIPNGRNTDGTLKTIRHTQTTVNIYTPTGATEIWFTLGSEIDNYRPYYEQTEKPSGSGLWFNPDTNLLLRSTDNGATWVQRKATIVGKLSCTTGGKITSFEPKTAFHAVDYNEFAAGDYVVKTYVSGDTWYRKYKSGWVEQGGSTMTGSQTVTFLIPFKSVPTMTWGFCTQRGSASYDGEVFFRSITATNFVSGSRMTNAISPGFMWRAEGMAA